MRAALTLHGYEAGGAVVHVEDSTFIIGLAREVLRGAEVAVLELLGKARMALCGHAEANSACQNQHP